jgi:thiaminase
MRFLEQTGTPFERFSLITNQRVPELDQLIDSLCQKYQKAIHIYESEWFGAHINESSKTVDAYWLLTTQNKNSEMEELRSLDGA